MTEKRKNRREIIQSIIFLELVIIEISFQLKFDILKCTLKLDEGRRTKQHIRPKQIERAYLSADPHEKLQNHDKELRVEGTIRNRNFLQ